MYCIFSNHERLRLLANSKQFDELLREFEKTEMIKISDFHGVNPSAQETYRSICDCIAEVGDKEVLEKLSSRAIKLFTIKKDVKSLQMIKGAPHIYGNLSDEGLQLIREFETLKKKALETYDKNSDAKSFKIVYDSIQVIFELGKLSFIWNDEEHRIFFGKKL